ncbi:PREDICTED: DNA repair protein XRCC2-like [Cyphomyrmex costatus]|uniref:DNA repair protein XRCC2 n=1 Tax=Cyphomyrmex costatus TaxID=456900 RepID=A0A195CPX3_9HYME|nr:PREDICTED: DNA repair protein XRCC2-like [Cyphomyrmex costatus]KYN02159.1 DNA repair protein XRCC2 [Cyphomyrmex costatus]
MEFHSEGGLELLSRFSEKSRSINLDDVLFSSDIDNKSIIEIIGASSTGKTVLLCQFIAKCILPARYKEIKINGCDACAILINTLGHVQISKIVELMTSMVCNAYQVADVQPLAETVDYIINRSLENLTVISCCNNGELQLILYTLEDELLSNERITLLAIDNILAYYWQARKENILTMNYYATSLLKIIRSQTSQFHTVTVYTRWDGPKYESHAKCTDILKRTGVNYRLQLSLSTKVHKFMCHVQSTNDVKQICYTISDSGIKWMQ